MSMRNKVPYCLLSMKLKIKEDINRLIDKANTTDLLYKDLALGHLTSIWLNFCVIHKKFNSKFKILGYYYYLIFLNSAELQKKNLASYRKKLRCFWKSDSTPGSYYDTNQLSFRIHKNHVSPPKDKKAPPKSINIFID